METKPSVCSQNKPRPTELRQPFSLCRRISSSFPQALPRLGRPCLWMGEAHQAHQEDMVRPVDPLASLQTAQEVMEDRPLPLPLAIHHSRHLRMAYPLVPRAGHQLTSSLPLLDSTAHHLALAVPLVSEALLAMRRRLDRCIDAWLLERQRRYFCHPKRHCALETLMGGV